MTNIVRRLFGTRPAAYKQASGVNHEGFPTFARSIEEQYVQTLLTNTLGRTFYASIGENYTQAQTLHQRMLEHDPAFAARAIVYAREQGFMRLQPIIGLVYLSLADRTLFRTIFPRVIQTPGDLLDFVQIVRSKQIRSGLGRMVKEEINRWLNSLSEYHAIKYGSDTGAKLSLRDVLRLTHPQPIDQQRDALFLYLTDRQKWRDRYGEQISTLLPQVAAVEQLKRTDDAEQIRALIEQGRLPYEVVTGAIRPDTATWDKLLRQMPYLALLRHLNTLQRAGLLADAEVVSYIVERLTNGEALRKAKVLPFRLHAAWVAFTPTTDLEQRVQQALAEALEGAFRNLPTLPGIVAVAPDVSGSMSGSIHAPSKVRYIDIAAIFTAALLRASTRALVLPFETSVVKMKIRADWPLIKTISVLAGIGGGGTAVSAPISELLARDTVVDVFIGITDNVEWTSDSYGGVGFLPTWRRYRETVAPHAQAFLITIAPYPQAVAPQDEPGVHYIYGWTDQVPAYIAQTLAGYSSQIAAVREIEL